MFKRFMQSNAVQVSLGFLIAAYMVLVKYTTRWETQGFDQASDIIGNGKGLIALTWHSRFLMLNSAWKKSWQMPHVLISRSRDGAVVAHTSHFLGLKTIRGSRRKKVNQAIKGGAKASQDIITALESGGCIVITPDGPRGPRQRMSEGALRLARLSGVPILPCTFAVKNRIQFQSWDRFVWPLPFGRGKIIWGTPVYVPSDTTDTRINEIKDRIEDEMNIFLGDADRALGHDVTDPDMDFKSKNGRTPL